MNLGDASVLARQLMRQHGIPFWEFAWNNRKESAGVCNYTKSTIFLSKIITPQMSEEEVRNTILHEIAHAIVGKGAGHGYVWQRKALEIGCNAERCFNGKNIKINYKYIGECPTCDTEFGQQRRPTRDSCCNKCNSRFDPNNLIVWKKVA